MSVNKVILLGNLGSDINVRHLPDGRMVGNVNIATTEVWRTQDGGKQKHTEWHRLNFFGRQAEVASEYLHKGSQIFIEGQLRTRRWEDKEGVERQTTEIRVMNFQMLGSRTERDRDAAGGGAPSWEGKSAKDGDQSRSTPPEADTKPKSKPKGEGGGDSFGDMEEDIPW